MIWTVIGPTNNLHGGSLQGSFVGVGANASVGVGAGANALVGGFSNSIVLQTRQRAGAEGPEHRRRRRRIAAHLPRTLNVDHTSAG
jgi:hypothetical protein